MTIRQKLFLIRLFNIVSITILLASVARGAGRVKEVCGDGMRILRMRY